MYLTTGIRKLFKYLATCDVHKLYHHDGDGKGAGGARTPKGRAEHP